MMGLPDGRESFKIRLAVLIQYRRVTDSRPPSHIAVASTRYAYLRRAVKIELQRIDHTASPTRTVSNCVFINSIMLSTLRE